MNKDTKERLYRDLSEILYLVQTRETSQAEELILDLINRLEYDQIWQNNS